MMESYGLTQQQKVGAFVTLFGLVFFVLGVAMFFDRGFLGVGNLGLLVGMTIGLGLSRTVALFRRSGLIGSASFLGGCVCVLCGRVYIGFAIELFGAFNCFRHALPLAITIGRYVPVVSSILELPIISWIANKVSPESIPTTE